MHIVADRHEPPEGLGESGSLCRKSRLWSPSDVEGKDLWFHSRRNCLGAGGKAKGSIFPQSSSSPNEHGHGRTVNLNPRSKGRDSGRLQVHAHGPSHPFSIIIAVLACS